jgi:hypothetical protein
VGLFIFNFLKIFIIQFIHMHTLFGSFLSSVPPPRPPCPSLLSLPGRTCSVLICNFVEEKT